MDAIVSNNNFHLFIRVFYAFKRRVVQDTCKILLNDIINVCDRLKKSMFFQHKTLTIPDWKCFARVSLWQVIFLKLYIKYVRGHCVPADQACCFIAVILCARRVEDGVTIYCSTWVFSKCFPKRPCPLRGVYPKQVFYTVAWWRSRKTTSYLQHIYCCLSEN